MSGAGPQLAVSVREANRPARGPMAHLLHALNQPLTGLQCAMEVALTDPRSADYYIRTLKDGLDLVARLRMLAEAMREVADLQAPRGEERVVVLLDNLLREAVTELKPVSESKRVHFRLDSTGPFPVRAEAGRLTALLFRSFECVIALSRRDSAVRILAQGEPGMVNLTVSWEEGPAPEHSPDSRAELGCLIAQCGWEQMGATWTQEEAGGKRTWTIRMPRAWTIQRAQSATGVI